MWSPKAPSNSNKAVKTLIKSTSRHFSHIHNAVTESMNSSTVWRLELLQITVCRHFRHRRRHVSAAAANQAMLLPRRRSPSAAATAITSQAARFRRSCQSGHATAAAQTSSAAAAAITSRAARFRSSCQPGNAAAAVQIIVCRRYRHHIAGGTFSQQLPIRPRHCCGADIVCRRCRHRGRHVPRQLPLRQRHCRGTDIVCRRYRHRIAGGTFSQQLQIRPRHCRGADIVCHRCRHRGRHVSAAAATRATLLPRRAVTGQIIVCRRCRYHMRQRSLD